MLRMMGTAALLLALLPGVVRAQQPAGVRVQKDVVYGTAEGEQLKLDLYMPATESQTSRPGMVFIHGGGWTGGDKAGFGKFARELAQSGFVAISVNYRLAPKHRYPAAVDDVRAAIFWLRAHAAEYRLDPNRVGAMGDSAGGHLAAFVGLTDAPQSATGLSSRVNCVVDYYGRADLRINQPAGTFTDYRQEFLGKSEAEAPGLWAEASPITHVDAKACPFLIVHGSRDKQVAPRNSIDLHDALDKAGIESTLVMLAGQGHGFSGSPAATAWSCAKAFLTRHLLAAR